MTLIFSYITFQKSHFLSFRRHYFSHIKRRIFTPRHAENTDIPILRHDHLLTAIDDYAAAAGYEQERSAAIFAILILAMLFWEATCRCQRYALSLETWRAAMIDTSAAFWDDITLPCHEDGHVDYAMTAIYSFQDDTLRATPWILRLYALSFTLRLRHYNICCRHADAAATPPYYATPP